jgi:4-amino-4-deoxy-L-arabinose transferase-like glycosyltransferase
VRLIRLLLPALLCLAALAYLIDLGGSSIWDANEAYYVETPREMLERGDWVNPTFNYEPRFNKPVLAYWVVGVLYKVFGVSVGVERIAIAGLAIVVIVAAWFLARAASVHPAAPVLAAIGLAANPRFFMFARRILIDVMLASFMTLILLFFALAERYPARRRLFLILMYIAVGLGVLAKGPVAAALPALVFLLYLGVHGEWRRLGDMMIPAGAVIALAIAAPWYVVLYAQGGWTHISSFLLSENVDRFTSTFGPTGRGPFFYLGVMFTDSLPWSLALPAALAVWLRDRRQATSSPDVRIRTLLWLWIAVIVVFFSFSQTKQDLYIFPIVSAVAVLGADVLARLTFSETRPGLVSRWLTGTLAVGALLLAGGGGFALYVISRAGPGFAIEGLTSAAVMALVAAVAIAILLMRRQPAAAVVVLASVFVTFNWLLVAKVLPSFERYKPVVAFSDIIRQRAQAGDTVAHFEAAMPSMVFYLQRHIDLVEDQQGFEKMMQSGRPVYVVLPERRYEELGLALGVRTCVLDRRPTAPVKLRDVLSGRGPDSLVLVTTRCQ